MTTALVTGADSGIGREFARQLAQKGYDIALVARDEEHLEETAGELRTHFPMQTEVIVADLSDRAQLETVARRLADPDRPVEILVNDAGFGVGKPFLDSDIDVEVDMLAVLCTAVLVLSHAAAKAMSARGSGTIINISSVAAYEGKNTYSAAKAWALSFSQGLARELAPTGVQCMAVCPGFTDTDFHRREGKDTSKMPKYMFMPPQEVVRVALSDLGKGKVVSVPTFAVKAFVAVKSVVPRGVVANIVGRRRIRQQDRSRTGPSLPRRSSTP
jgi:uncharacterized protein